MVWDWDDWVCETKTKYGWKAPRKETEILQMNRNIFLFLFKCAKLKNYLMLKRIDITYNIIYIANGNHDTDCEHDMYS